LQSKTDFSASPTPNLQKTAIFKQPKKNKLRRQSTKDIFDKQKFEKLFDHETDDISKLFKRKNTNSSKNARRMSTQKPKQKLSDYQSMPKISKIKRTQLIINKIDKKTSKIVNLLNQTSKNLIDDLNEDIIIQSHKGTKRNRRNHTVNNTMASTFDSAFDLTSEQLNLDTESSKSRLSSVQHRRQRKMLQTQLEKSRTG
jgi:hypothetical protein